MRTMTREFTIIEHTADMALEVRGDTLDELFTAAAEGLGRLFSPSDDIRPAREFHIEKEAPSLERLVVEFLSEMVFLHEMEGLLFAEFEVSVAGKAEGGGPRLRAAVRGETYDPERHELDSPVKAVTQHMLSVDRTDDGWKATIVMDT